MTDYLPGPIRAKGCFTGEFGLGEDLPIDEAPYVIERDRINEGKLPGFGRKLLPLKQDHATGERTAGGYYLLDTFEQAKYMFDWYQDPVDGYVLDGIPILERAYFLKPLAHYWHVAGAHDFKRIDTSQKIVRFERWHCDRPDLESRVIKEWPEIKEKAGAEDYASIWLLYNPEQTESLAMVSVSEGSASTNSETPDFAGIETFAQKPSLAACFEQNAWAKRSFDRTSWIFSIWFPYNKGPLSKKTVWPNSPPFPGL